MSTVVVATVKSNTSSPPAFENTSGTEIGRLCRAFVNFDGATGTIRASYNVSSITKHATGQYTINFTTALSDANYALVGACRGVDSTDESMETLGISNGTAPTASAVRIAVAFAGSSSFQDAPAVMVAIFR